MAELATTARPYARAAFANAGASSQLVEWGAFLGRAAAAVQDPQVVPLIGNPRVPASQLVDFLLELASPGKPAAPEVAHQRNFLQLLADNRRLKLLPEIAAQFEVLRAEAERIADVEVISHRASGRGDARRLTHLFQGSFLCPSSHPKSAT
jgi:F-type H+-transporting ATPase subunit delta